MVFIAGEPPVPRAGAPGAPLQYFARALSTKEVRTPKAKPNWGIKIRDEVNMKVGVPI